MLNGWILHSGGVALGRFCPTACAAGLFIPIHCWANYLLNGIFGIAVANIENVLWYSLCMGIFGGFWALMNKRKLQNLQNITLRSNCHSKTFFCYKMNFHIKCLIVALDDFEDKITVLYYLLGARNTSFFHFQFARLCMMYPPW